MEDAAIYKINLKVTDKCRPEPLVVENVDMDGKLQVRSIPFADLSARIKQEEFSDKPIIVIPGGDSQLRVDSGFSKDQLTTIKDSEDTNGPFDDDKEWFLSQERG